MVDFDETFERIKLATKTRTQVELAKVLDIRQSSISDAKRRNSVPSDWVVKLFDQFGLSPDWLRKGVGPMYLRTDQGYIPVEGPAVGVSEDVSRYDSAAAKNLVTPVYSTADTGAPDHALASVGRLSIPHSFSCPGLLVLSIASAATEPFIRKSAYVGVDTSSRNITSGELYAVRVPHEGIVIKRAYVDAQNKSLVLRSEKPEHPEIVLPIDGHHEHIVGKAVWVLQRL